MAGGGRGAAALGGLDHDSPTGYCGDDAVTGQEAETARPSARRVLADDGPVGGDVGEQATVLAGVGDAGTAGENGDGEAADDESSVVERPR